ncbi:MAG: 7TM diverse intracellular signaling domain-containing protein, partial [Brachymonas sp.]
MAITESVQLIHSGDFAYGANLVGTLQGLIIGLFGLFTVISLVSAQVNRNSHFAWFALFTFSVMFAHLTVTGYFMVRIWPQSVYLTQTMIWVAPLLSLAAMARFALAVSYAQQLSRPIHYAMWAVVGVSTLLSLIVMMPSSYARDPLNILYAMGVFTVVVSMSWIAWRSQKWLWLIVFSLIPICFSVAVRLAYNMGWFAHVEQAMLAAVITTSLGLVVTYGALVMHQRERLSALQHQRALETRDATTGLFIERIAKARLPQIILRSKRFGQPCGAIMVRWLDMNRIMLDGSIAERGRILAHLGNRLGRLSRDIDTVARLSEDLFVYLVEAPVNREQLSELASHVLSTCMRPSQVMPDQKGFELHLAIWLSSETQAEAEQVFEMLNTRINQMRDGTQRRVQFVDTSLSTSSDQDKTSAESAQRLVDKINALEATQGLPRISLPDRQMHQISPRPAQ